MIHFQVRHLMGVLECHQLIAVPITTGKKKDTVVCPLLRHSNYNQKKKIQSSGHHSLRRSNCNCCAVPITTGKKGLIVVTPFQLRPEKKDTVVWPSFVAPFQLSLLRRSNYHRKKKDTVICPLLCRSKYDRKKKSVEKIIYEKKNFTIYRSCTIPIVVELKTHKLCVKNQVEFIVQLE